MNRTSTLIQRRARHLVNIFQPLISSRRYGTPVLRFCHFPPHPKPLPPGEREDKDGLDESCPYNILLISGRHKICPYLYLTNLSLFFSLSAICCTLHASSAIRYPLYSEIRFTRYEMRIWFCAFCFYLFVIYYI